MPVAERWVCFHVYVYVYVCHVCVHRCAVLCLLCVHGLCLSL